MKIFSVNNSKLPPQLGLMKVVKIRRGRFHVRTTASLMIKKLLKVIKSSNKERFVIKGYYI